MPRYKRAVTYKESPYAKDLVIIMKAGKGSYTRSMLAEALEKRYPSLSWQDLLDAVSSAILMDRWSKKNRFEMATTRGWYQLAK
jgi:hypothetical protein